MLPSTSMLSILALLLLTFIFVLSAALLHTKRGRDAHKQPPGPSALPLIGNLNMLGTLPHRTLQSLAKRYGSIMSLRLGQVPAVVISSPEAAELVLKTHDTVFASRPKLQASEYLFYGSKGMSFSEYGPYWRNLRKLCTLHLFTASKVGSFAPLRREELGLLVQLIEKAAAAREVVDLSESVGKLIEDITCKMILGHKLDNRFDGKGIVHEALALVGAFNTADYIPWLRAFDLQGLTRQLKKTSKELDEMLEMIVKEHEHAPNVQKGHHKDFVGILLSLMDQPLDLQDQNKHVVDRTIIKAMLVDVIFGAFDTSATVLEWAFSELLRHPRVMKILQDEIKSVVGMSKLVEEADLPNLSYLEMVIKEVLRLYPVAPLLVPRESTQDITIDGYHIRKRSRIIVNAWAIGRDPKVWSNAELFYPERFINNNIDLRGQDFQLLPFGSGRRRCPAMHLGLVTVRLILAQLVHCFNWELPFGMTPDDLDMNERFGLSMPRAQHLLAVPTLRLSSL